MAWVHVKDRTQSPTFAHQSAATRTTCAGFVRPSNDPGAQGTACLGDLALGGTASFYFEQSNRTGFRCATLDPLTQNCAACRLSLVARRSSLASMRRGTAHAGA